jgi:drug/metabolite transporter (DMT)-like permease
MEKHATKIGVLGLLLWAFAAFFNSQLYRIPIFEILTIALGIGFLGGCIRILTIGTWKELEQPLKFYLIGFLGVFGNELLYVSAFKFAPPCHIVLINYLWPILVVFFAGSILKEEASWRYGIAAILGFFSIGFFLYQHESVLSQYWLGYLFAFLAACFWSFYVLAYRRCKAMTPEMLTCYCGLGCIISFFIHHETEVFILPTAWEAISLTWLGIIGMCIAFNFWNFGIKNGNIRLLSILSYNNIILSTAILILLGEAYFEPAILWATMGLVISYSLFIFKTS